MKNFDPDTLETGQTREPAPINPLKEVLNKAEGFYLFDETNKSYLDLTSNNDYMPLGFSGGHKNNLAGFFDSENLKSKDALTLETLLKEVTGFEKSYVFQEKNLANNFLKEIISTKPEKSVLISALEKDNFSFEDKEIISIQLNDTSSVKTFVNKNCAAVIVEIAQIKDSLNIAEISYLKFLKDYCAKNDALLIYDTCSISPLRLNRGLFHFDEAIKPNALIASKGLTSGIPLYLVLFDNQVPDTNITTGTYSLGYAEAVDFIQNHENHKATIETNSAYIEKNFQKLTETHIGFADFISYGMLYSLVTEIPSDTFVKAAFDKGLILKPLDTYTLLFCPPYNLDKKEIDGFMNIFDELFDKLTKYDRLKE